MRLEDEETETAVRAVMKMNVEEKKGGGRPGKRRLDTVKNDLKAVGVRVEISGGLGQG